MWSHSWRRAFVALTAIGGIAGSAWFWYRAGLEAVSWVWGIIGGLTALYLILRESVRNDGRGGLERSARQRELLADLADAVRRDPAVDAALRAVELPYPLPTRWATADDALQPSWRSIGRSSAGRRLDLDGRDDIMATFQHVPSGRLLALGPAGSGKSILAIRLVGRLMRERTPDDPVPILLRVASWQPRLELTAWLVEQIIQRHPELYAAYPDCAELLADLVEAGSILPVLDGLDEAAEGDLAVRFVAAWNRREGSRLFLTCRDDYYAEHLAGRDKLRAAAVIVVEPLDPAVVVDYFDDALPSRRREAWAPVLDRLSDPGFGALRAAFGTPLMVATARTVFESSDQDPHQILQITQTEGRRAVEDHLLSLAVDSAVRAGPGDYDAVHVRMNAPRYLSYLADRMTVRGSDRLVWWRLAAEVPAWFWMLLGGVLGYALTSTVIRLLDPFLSSFAWRGRPLDLTLVTGHAGFWSSLAAIGGGIGLSIVAYSPGPPRRAVFRGGLRAAGRRLVNMLAVGAFVSINAFIALNQFGDQRAVQAAADRLTPGPHTAPHPAATVAAALFAGLLVYEVCAAAFAVDFAAPADPYAAGLARRWLSADRAASLLAVLPRITEVVVALTVACALAGLLPGVDVPPLREQAVAGATIGATWWLLSLVGRTWVMTTAARLFLVTTGDLPLIPFERFLAFATRAGVLRNDGDSFRFSHGRVQQQLAAGHPGPASARRRLDLAVELADLGYSGHAATIARAVSTQRRHNGGSTALRAEAARILAYAGGISGSGTVVEDLRRHLPTSPHDADDQGQPVAAARTEFAALLAEDAPPTRLRDACHRLLRAEIEADLRSGNSVGFPLTATVELTALVEYLVQPAADRPAARQHLDRIYRGLPDSAPVLAALLTVLHWTQGDRQRAHEICRDDTARADAPANRHELERRLETWSWSAEILDRIHAALGPDRPLSEGTEVPPALQHPLPALYEKRSRLTAAELLAERLIEVAVEEADNDGFDVPPAYGLGVWSARVLRFLAAQPGAKAVREAAERRRSNELSDRFENDAHAALFEW